MRVAHKTIALNAPIVELSIAAPEWFAAFKDQHTRKHKLGKFAGKFLDAIPDSLISSIQLHHSRKIENCCLLARRIPKFSRAVDVDVC